MAPAVALARQRLTRRGRTQRRRGGERRAGKQDVAAVQIGLVSRLVFCVAHDRFLSLDDTSESDVACGRIDRFRMARGRAIAAAVIRRAKMRAAFDALCGEF